jgi:hypothetical protein
MGFVQTTKAANTFQAVLKPKNLNCNPFPQSKINSHHSKPVLQTQKKYDFLPNISGRDSG